MQEIVSSILPQNINQEIIKLLKMTEGWYFGFDDKTQNSEIETDEGLALRTFGNNCVTNNNTKTLNMFAYIIASIVSNKLNINFKGLKRVNYNFYHSFSEGKQHIDSEHPKCVSILYNLNTNDGTTEIGNEKFISNASEAVVFDSNKLHKGTGPTKGLRYNLNIIIYT
jgi:hypothetical protein|tara:strand:- start:321 stop:824 length:504 start_codon:yes stop_codon:yes gene_type:complete